MAVKYGYWEALRAAAQDWSADKVDRAPHAVEHGPKSQGVLQDVGAWFTSLFYGKIMNYGVRPYRLIAVSLALLLAGTLFFQLPGTVMARQQAPGSDPPASVELSWLDAFGVSLHYFLPTQILFTSRWVPLEPGPSAFATFCLQIPGWFLIPLAVAGLTGLARRNR